MRSFCWGLSVRRGMRVVGQDRGEAQKRVFALRLRDVRSKGGAGRPAWPRLGQRTQRNRQEQKASRLESKQKRVEGGKQRHWMGARREEREDLSLIHI